MTASRRYPPSFESGGETGELLRSHDWASTPLGPIEQWPQSLKTIVSTLLHSRHPMVVWWGPELVQIYNDAFLPSFGRGKHPRAMGQRAEECWPEIWSILGPQIDDVMQRGKASWHEDQHVAVRRDSGTEEVYWTYGYSPVFDDRGDVGGTLVVCTETTSRVLAERRFGTVRALVEKLAPAMDALTVARIATDVFAGASADIPFALVHLRDERTAQIHLVSSVGVGEERLALVDELVRDETRAWRGGAPFEPVIARGAKADRALPGGPWPEAAPALYVAPIVGAQDTPVGAVSFGLSPRLPFDERYRAHLDGVAEQLAAACAAILRGPPTVRRRSV